MIVLDSIRGESQCRPHMFQMGSKWDLDGNAQVIQTRQDDQQHNTASLETQT